MHLTKLPERVVDQVAQDPKAVLLMHRVKARRSRQKPRPSFEAFRGRYVVHVVKDIYTNNGF